MDTAPGPVPVYRALKRQPLVPAVKTNSWNLSLRQHSDDLCNCTTGTSTAKCTANGRIARIGSMFWTMRKPQRHDGEVNDLEDELQLRNLQTKHCLDHSTYKTHNNLVPLYPVPRTPYSVHRTPYPCSYHSPVSHTLTPHQFGEVFYNLTDPSHSPIALRSAQKHDVSCGR